MDAGSVTGKGLAITAFLEQAWHFAVAVPVLARYFQEGLGHGG